MYRYKIETSLIAVAIFIASCGSHDDKLSQVINYRDSLAYKSEMQAERIKNLEEVIEMVNFFIDSIVSRDNAVILTVNNEVGLSKKQQVLDNLSKLEITIKTQEDKINDLENRLSDNSDSTSIRLKETISLLKRQLERKNNELVDLRVELTKKKTDIATLRAVTSRQSEVIAELENTTALQREGLARQDKVINECCMIISDKKSLEKLGIVKKGKISTQNILDDSKFVKIDIRTFNEMVFEAKRPRILTSMPVTSYSLERVDKGKYILKIINPTDFWSVSNYLVIQTN